MVTIALTAILIATLILRPDDPSELNSTPANTVASPSPVAIAPRAASPPSIGVVDRRDEDIIQRSDTEKFVAWLRTANNIEMPSIFTGEDGVRDKLATIQREASTALISYEKATSRFAVRRGQLGVIQRCKVRSDQWTLLLSDRLSKEEADDVAASKLRRALTSDQRDTADAYYHWTARRMQSFYDEDCAQLALEPFMGRYDAYVRGELITLD